jgi:hypothetical protein
MAMTTGHNFSQADMMSTAKKLAARPPHQNPAITPSAMQTHVKPASQALVMATLNNPVTADIAAGGDGTGTGANALNPKNARTRSGSVRHQICGFAQVSLPANTTTGVSAIPYQRFAARRAVIAPMTISGGGDASSAVSNWQVGTIPQFASLDAEPISSFAASNQAGFLDFDECAPSLSISAQVKVAATITFWGCLVGEAPGQAIQDRPKHTKVARLPIKSTAIAPTTTVTVTATTTVDFWGRKIVLADAGTNQFGDTFNVTAGANGASGLLLSNLYVANVPQFLTAPTANVTTYVPCSLFVGLYDLWLDLDRATVAIPYTFQVYNPGTVTLLFSGVIEGDIAA